MKEDEYKTIVKPTEEVLYKDRNSKFFGIAFPVESENEVKDILLELKKSHPNANHWCYAYQIGLNEPDIVFRANDDGEPKNSAGTPIYGQIKAFGLTNILVVVIRYFGGTKLGVSGLINAYKTTAEIALNKSKIIKRTIRKFFLIEFDYIELNSVMRLIKDNNIKIESNESGMTCKMKISVRLANVEKILSLFNNLYKVNIKDNF